MRRSLCRDLVHTTSMACVTLEKKESVRMDSAQNITSNASAAALYNVWRSEASSSHASLNAAATSNARVYCMCCSTRFVDSAWSQCKTADRADEGTSFAPLLTGKAAAHKQFGFSQYICASSPVDRRGTHAVAAHGAMRRRIPLPDPHA